MISRSTEREGVIKETFFTVVKFTYFMDITLEIYFWEQVIREVSAFRENKSQFALTFLNVNMYFNSVRSTFTGWKLFST